MCIITLVLIVVGNENINKKIKNDCLFDQLMLDDFKPFMT